MTGKPQSLTKGQKREIIWLFWKQVLAIALVICALTGLGLWGIYCRIMEKVEGLVAKQFEEPRIQQVVSNVAETKAEALLLQQINPEVEKFKVEINSQLEEIKTIVAKIEDLKSQSDSNAEQIEKVLSFVQNSQKQIEKSREVILGLHSDLVKIERLIVEMQYYAYKSRGMFGKNPYQERIEQTLNKLLKIAIPDAQERSKFVEELKAYQPKK